jgi:uncharacterized protein
MTPSIPTSFLDNLVSAFREGDPLADAKTAEAENVHRVRVIYEAIARGDYDAFADCLHADAEMEIFGPKINAFVGRSQGREQVRETVRRNFSQVEDQQPEILTVVAQGDTVVVVGRETGRYRPTGQRYDMHWVQLFTLRDGRIARFRQVTDTSPIHASILR